MVLGVVGAAGGDMARCGLGHEMPTGAALCPQCGMGPLPNSSGSSDAAQGGTGQLPGPGWYPDPGGPGQRWWDGSTWTQDRMPPSPTTTGVVTSRPPSQSHVTYLSLRRLVPSTRRSRAVVGGTALAMIGGLTAGLALIASKPSSAANENASQPGTVSFPAGQSDNQTCSGQVYAVATDLIDNRESAYAVRNEQTVNGDNDPFLYEGENLVSVYFDAVGQYGTTNAADQMAQAARRWCRHHGNPIRANYPQDGTYPGEGSASGDGSSQDATYTVPNVIGLSGLDAGNAISASGLHPQIDPACYSSGDLTVTSQDPAPGSTVTAQTFVSASCD